MAPQAQAKSLEQLFSLALQQHQAGRFEAAEQGYQKILQAQPMDMAEAGGKVIKCMAF